MPDNVPTITRQPRYINIAADGSLDLPAHLRSIVTEFEQQYENTRYRRLQPCGRPRSLTGAVDEHGNTVYDRLQRGISPIATYHGDMCSRGVRIAAVKKEHKHCHSVDLGELRGFIGALQGDARSMEATHVPGTLEHKYQRRFSIDMGHLREFIALRETKISTKEESSALADQPEA